LRGYIRTLLRHMRRRAIERELQREAEVAGAKIRQIAELRDRGVRVVRREDDRA